MNLKTLVLCFASSIILVANGCWQSGKESICQSSEIGEQMSEEKSRVVLADMLKYYSAHSVITAPGEYAYLFEGLPSALPELVRVVQGVLMHGGHSHRYGIKVSEEKRQKQEHSIRKIEDMLKRMAELDDRPIVFAREPEKRLLVSCRSFAVLMCSLLRNQGIPSRARGGFETYFLPEIHAKHHDHWICEYWDSAEQHWVQIDAQIDDILRKAMIIKVDTLDLPNGAFLTGGQAWQLCRAERTDPNIFGVWDNENSRWICGWDFIQAEVILDLMALNKFELLPWDGNTLSRTDVKQLSDAEYALLDKVAELTTTGNREFADMRALYESNSALRMPAGWKP